MQIIYFPYKYIPHFVCSIEDYNTSSLHMELPSDAKDCLMLLCIVEIC